MVKMNISNLNDNNFAYELDRLEQKQIKGGFFMHGCTCENNKTKSSKSQSSFSDKFSFDANGKKMIGINSREITDSGTEIVNRIIKSPGGKVITNGKEY